MLIVVFMYLCCDNLDEKFCRMIWCGRASDFLKAAVICEWSEGRGWIAREGTVVGRTWQNHAETMRDGG